MGVRASLPLCAWARPISSFTLRASTEGCTASTMGMVTASDTGAKPLIRSYDSFAYRLWFIVSVESIGRISV